MALTAIFSRRRMFENKGPALFLVTGNARFIEARFFKVGNGGAAMRIMTVAADRLALLDRMSRRQIGLCTLLRVTIEANTRLLILVQHGIALNMHPMTVVAAQILEFVGTGVPMHSVGT